MNVKSGGLVSDPTPRYPLDHVILDLVSRLPASLSVFDVKLRVIWNRDLRAEAPQILEMDFRPTATNVIQQEVLMVEVMP